MKRKALETIDQILARLPDGQPDSAAVRARAARHATDCGCAMGAAFLVAAVLIAAAYFVWYRTPHPGSVLIGAAGVFLAAIAGKLVGLLLAAIRLALLKRKLLRRPRSHEAHHVDVYEMGYQARHHL
jgi:hypothetical protein